MMLAIIGPSLILALLIAYEIRKNSAKERSASEKFWDKENKANSSRKKDISLLDYIIVPVDRLPFGLMPAFDELTATEDEIRKLSHEKIYSLKNRSNTDVKLEYGVPNFEFMCACDERYMKLIRLLSKEAELLHSMSFENEAEDVLKYSLSIGSDIPKDYIRLAEFYRNRNDRPAVEELIRRADSLDLLTKRSLVSTLEDIRDSF